LCLRLAERLRQARQAKWPAASPLAGWVGAHAGAATLRAVVGRRRDLRWWRTPRAPPCGRQRCSVHRPRPAWFDVRALLLLINLGRVKNPSWSITGGTGRDGWDLRAIYVCADILSSTHQCGVPDCQCYRPPQTSRSATWITSPCLQAWCRGDSIGVSYLNRVWCTIPSQNLHYLDMVRSTTTYYYLHIVFHKSSYR
jgi:hypothetical protein